jgi:hypothetical protein
MNLTDCGVWECVAKFGRMDFGSQESERAMEMQSEGCRKERRV